MNAPKRAPQPRVSAPTKSACETASERAPSLLRVQSTPSIPQKDEEEEREREKEEEGEEEEKKAPPFGERRSHITDSGHEEEVILPPRRVLTP